MNYHTYIRRIGKALLLVCCLWLLTGPLLLLQLGAWSWMLASYSQQSSLEQAIIETFGGNRPCEVCKFIQETNAESFPLSEQKPKNIQGFKLLPGTIADICITSEYTRLFYPLAQTQFLLSPDYKIPTPPPRLV